MRSINFKGGLTRIWIVLSAIYAVFALMILAENSDCVSYLERQSIAAQVERESNSKVSRLMNTIPELLSKELWRGKRDVNYYFELGYNHREKKTDHAIRIEQLRKKYADTIEIINAFWRETYNHKAKVGSCNDSFIWRIGGKRYANKGTMLGTALGGLILLWGSLYTLLGVGRGLSWVKEGFTEKPSTQKNKSESIAVDEEKEVENELDKKSLLEIKPDTKNLDIEVGAEPLLVKLPDTNKLDEEPDLILGEATDTSTKLNEVKKRNTPMWVVKSILMTLVSFVVAIMIPAAITTYVIPIETISRTFLSLVIWSASFFPIWQSDRELKQRLVAWLLGASAGGIAYLSYKALCRSLYSSGTLDIDMVSKLIGLSTILGGAVALGISYLINNRKNQKC
jgi:hypothetical protein